MGSNLAIEWLIGSTHGATMENRSVRSKDHLKYFSLSKTQSTTIASRPRYPGKIAG
ncbi:hypothetical protein AM1_F0172 (plasmid) [Acaryochloris marina MBIC11017]|uniref:Uncharacterized protein n=1 Tax=Acaryochloris marina (strain MBIC 11017) TaxID=329726 RepID=A8ZPW6_ACAM1|nr:hypothetical protein AM1_F0172 [Acaryochloris marina MBIC11017]